MRWIKNILLLAPALFLFGCAGGDYPHDGEYFNDYSDPYVDDEDDWFYDYYYYNNGQYDYEPDPDI